MRERERERERLGLVVGWIDMHAYLHQLDPHPRPPLAYIVLATHPRKRLKFFEKLFKKAPKPRLPPSPADASSLAGCELQTEEDVLHVRSRVKSLTRTHTHTYIYIYTYIYRSNSNCMVYDIQRGVGVRRILRNRRAHVLQ